MKTKFDMMCENYWGAYERAIKSKEENFNFLKNFRKQLLEYLVIPEDELIFSPIKDNPANYYDDQGKDRNNLLAFSMSEDGFFNIGFAFKVYKAKNVFPNIILCFELKFRKENDVFKLKFGNTDNIFCITPNVPGDINKALDHICFLVEEYFSEKSRSVKENGEAVKIGFI